MAPPRFFSRSVISNRRGGVSELYASVLLIVVTLAFGGAVALAAASQFSAGTSGGSLAASQQANSLGKEVSMVYGTAVQGSGGCASVYVGPDGASYTEGRTFNV